MEFYQMPEKNRLQQTVTWVVDLIVVIVLACYTVYAFGGRVEVVGHSMQPVLMSEDVILMNRLAYDFAKPRRFDIVVFNRPDAEYNIKRVVGLPGETVQIKDNRIYIDGERLEAEEESLCLVSIAGLAQYPIELKEDEYFLLGDNRDSSEDSRFASVGNVKREQLEGKVWLRAQPFSAFRLIRS